MGAPIVSKENGFLPLRRGIWEHLRDGRMSVMECLAFIYICSQADTRSGVWKGSAKSLSGEIGIPERTARDVLEKMEHGDYIRRFAIPGRHICYPILIHKFPITQGEHNGEHLNATESTSPADLRYFSREQSVEQDGEHGVEHGAAQRRSENRDKRRKPRAAEPAAPADPRFQPFVDYAYKTFQGKHGQRPNWNGRDFKTLKALLGENQTITAAELERRWNHYAQSTEPFTAKQGDSLAYFCAKFDSFIDGPIFTQPKGVNRNGKPTLGDNLRTTLGAMRAAETKLPS
jgi:hypothetical protein